MASRTPTVEPVPDAAAVQEVTALVRKVEAGDLSQLGALRKALNEAPAIWQHTGDLANAAVLAWVQAASGGNEAMREMVTRKMGHLWRELAGDHPGPLERLILDRITVSWLAVWHADAVYARQMDRLDRKWALFCLERIDRAQRRYLAAIKALAQIRRLLGAAHPTPTPTATDKE